MRSKTKILLIALAIALTVSPLVVAQEEPSASSAGDMLQFGTDAKSLGMGGAFVAVADNYSATYWNPAGLGQVEGFNIGGMAYKPYDINGLDYVFGSGSFSLGQVTVGGGYSQFGADMGNTDTFYNHEGSYREGMAIGSVALNLDIFNAGANLKYYSLPEGGGVGFDGGMLVKFDGISLGAVAQDIGVEEVPMAFRVGGAVDFLDLVLASVQLDLIGDATTLRAGVEVTPIELMAIRAGLAMPQAEGVDASFSVGGGLNLAGLTVDVAYMTNGAAFSGRDNTGGTLVLSAGFEFAGMTEEGSA